MGGAAGLGHKAISEKDWPVVGFVQEIVPTQLHVLPGVWLPEFSRVRQSEAGSMRRGIDFALKMRILQRRVDWKEI